MPWKDHRTMSQKTEFVQKALAPGANVSALCREFGISRQTGHKWLRRFRAEGHLGLVDQSRRPRSSPLATGEDVVVAILELRGRHPSWGADTIAGAIASKFGDEAPSRSTVARVLTRLGKIKRRRPRVRLWTTDGRPHVEVKAPNDLWTIDFKGWWRAQNGEKCEPLTVRDACSRKVLAVALLPSNEGYEVRRVLERLFKRHGLPAVIQSDNGSPFVCTHARGGLTRLSAWLISLGIRLVRSRPGCPQDNGGHERMHKDLSELELAPARSRPAQQLRCDRWMNDFNHVRPHSALGGRTPAEVYRDSPRRSVTSRVPQYPPEWKARRVLGSGRVHVNGDEVFVSMALAGYMIGLRPETPIRWRAQYFDVDLGVIEVVTLSDALGSVAGLAALDQPTTQRKRQRRSVSA